MSFNTIRQCIVNAIMMWCDFILYYIFHCQLHHGVWFHNILYSCAQPSTHNVKNVTTQKIYVYEWRNKTGGLKRFQIYHIIMFSSNSFMGNEFIKYVSGVTRRLKLNKMRTIKMHKATDLSIMDTIYCIKKKSWILTLSVSFFYTYIHCQKHS